MTTILRTRTSQPQSPVGIDWGNPITRGLSIAINAAGYNFAQSRVPCATNSTAFSWVRGSPRILDTGVANPTALGHSCLIFVKHTSLLGGTGETYISNTVAATRLIESEIRRERGVNKKDISPDIDSGKKLFETISEFISRYSNRENNAEAVNLAILKIEKIFKVAVNQWRVKTKRRHGFKGIAQRLHAGHDVAGH